MTNIAPVGGAAGAAPSASAVPVGGAAGAAPSASAAPVGGAAGAAPSASAAGATPSASAAPWASAAGSEVLLRPVRGGNPFEETVQRLLQTIRLGAVGPGERMPSERELAVRLGVSRDTLREAIAALAEVGMLISRRGRYGGTFVAEGVTDEAGAAAEAELGISDTAPNERRWAAEAEAVQLEDALALRAILEVGAVRLTAARTLAAVERDRIWLSLEDCRGANPSDYRRLDSRLHLTLGECAGVPSLVPLLADARSRANTLLDGIPLLARNISHSDEQHQRIVTAVLAGRPDEAEAAMREHLDGTAALLRGFFS